MGLFAVVLLPRIEGRILFVTKELDRFQGDVACETMGKCHNKRCCRWKWDIKRWLARGGHFSHENPHLNPISHFSGPNSIFFIKMSCRKWEMGCKHSKSSFPTSDFPFLTSHISFPACHISFSLSYFMFLYDPYENLNPS